VIYLGSFCGAGITGTSNSGIRVVGSGVEETGVKGTGYCLVTVNGVGGRLACMQAAPLDLAWTLGEGLLR
jgi:hypothetical protein